jgi:hypothetical protein
MWIRIALTLALVLGGWTYYSPPVYADGYVETTGIYAEGAPIRGNRYDTGGNLKVSGNTGITSLGTATAAAPTLVEGAPATFSFDTLTGAVRVQEMYLRVGDDQTRNLVMTGPGFSSQQVIATAMVVAGDAAFKTSQAGFGGSKTFQGRVTGTGAITQTMKIYGSFNSVPTLTNSSLLCTLTLSGTTEASDSCPVVTANYAYYSVVTSATTGTSASGELIMGWGN